MSSDLVDAWIHRHEFIHAEQIKPSEDKLFWAWEEMTDMVFNRPEEAWSIILELIAHAPSNRVLADIAAGPLEDLISRYPEQFIGRVEEQARRYPRFRLCLTGVWYGNDLPEDIRDTIKKYVSTSPHIDDSM